MRLRIHRVRLLVSTGKGLVMCDIPFANGLNVLRGDNSSGKSTCLQAIAYGLGLEGMWGSSHRVPLQLALTEVVEIDGQELPVLESTVFLEIEGTENRVATVSRPIAGVPKTNLIRVWEDYRIDETEGSPSSDYYVRMSGAASRPSGFHHWLEKFVGWDLPQVARYDGDEAPLYLECVFPLLFVEQKRGWSTIPATFPMYFRIREVGRRAVEFLLGFHVLQLMKQRQIFQGELDELKTQWHTIKVRMETSAGLANTVVNGVPSGPSFPISATVLVPVNDDRWLDLPRYIDALSKRLTDLNEKQRVGPDSAEQERLLTELEEELADSEMVYKRLAHEQAANKRLSESMNNRLKDIQEDIESYRDLRKLLGLGSASSLSISRGHCPVCGQAMHDTLAPSETVMSVEENLSYLGQQLQLTKSAWENSTKVIHAVDVKLRALRSNQAALRRQIGSINAALIRRTNEDTIREVVHLEEEINQKRAALRDVEACLDDLHDIGRSWEKLSEAIRALPKRLMDDHDEELLQAFQRAFVELLDLFGFSSVQSSRLQLSPDNMRPVYDGLDVTWDLSASDVVRSIWAYLVGLLDIARVHDTNHPGLLILDEPRQQSARRESLRALLRHLQLSLAADQQVIVATSEEEDDIASLLAGVACNYIPIAGKLLKMGETSSR